MIQFVNIYLHWHYGRAFGDVWGIWKDLSWFGYHFFSIGLLFKTLFAPFHRVQLSYGRGLDINRIVESAIINTIMRLVGFLLRSVVIFFGLVFEIFLVLMLPIIMFVWVFLPFLVLFFALFGILFIF